MAVDSTGDNWVVGVRCHVCFDTIQVHAYKPQFGHAGEPLKEGPYVDVITTPEEAIKRLDRGSLFRIIRNGPGHDGPVIVEPIFLKRAQSPYAYGGFYWMGFGTRVQHVLWICSDCTRYLRSRRHLWVRVYDAINANRSLDFQTVWNTEAEAL